MMKTHLLTQFLRKSTSTLMAVAVAFGLLIAAPHTLAANMTWINGGSGFWTNATAWQTNTATSFDPVGLTNIECMVVTPGFTVVTNCNVGGSGAPSTSDRALFTNAGPYTVTVNITTNVMDASFLSNSVVTIDASGQTLTVTNQFSVVNGVGTLNTTSTVYWAGGTLAITNALQTPGNPLSIGQDGTNNLGVFAVTNGTVIVGPGSAGNRRFVRVGGNASAGKLVISGSALLTNAVGNQGTLSIGNGGNNAIPGSWGSQLIISNGAKVVVDGFFRADCQNALVQVSDPNSLLSINSFIVGNNSTGNSGIRLIVSNSATLRVSNTGTIGDKTPSCTGIVAGASVVMGVNELFIGTGSPPGGVGNFSDLAVYDGGYISADNVTNSIGGGAATGCTFHMGGTGATSTGTFARILTTSGSSLGGILVTNALLTASRLQLNGLSNSLAVLGKGTLVLNAATNVLDVNASYGAVTIDGGTINAVSSSNAAVVVISGTNSLSVINSGKLLSEQVTLGAGGASYVTGTVSGVGSVWSNYTTGVSWIGTNSIRVGSGSGGNNCLVVQSGASLVNNGSLSIGTVSSIGNSLVINGGTVSTSFLKVQSTNSVAFPAGTLGVGGVSFETGANATDGSAVPLVVGDGTSAAYYDMAAGGDGYHDCNAGGLVITNGAYLRGSGTLKGRVTVLGTFVPGFSVGTVIASNDLTFGSFAVLNYDLGTSSDQVTVNGDLTLGGTLNVSNSGGFAAVNYVLFTHTNTTTAPPGTLTVGTLPPGFTATVSNDVPNAQVLLVVSAVVTDPYSSWLTNYGLTPGGNGLGTADPDGDGMINTNEFLAGFNPTNNAAALNIISTTRSGNNIVLNYRASNGDTTYSGGPSTRTNVIEFTPGAPSTGYFTNNFTGLATNILSGGVGTGAVTSVTDTGGATNVPARYYRVRVLLP